MKRLFVPAFSVLIPASCGGGGSATFSSNNGRLVVVITDAPAEDFSQVDVRIF